MTIFSIIRSRASMVTGVPCGAWPTQIDMPRLRVHWMLWMKGFSTRPIASKA